MATYLIMYRITNNIYICDRQKATDLDSLVDNNIKGMLYLNIETKPDAILKEFTELKIQHYHLPIEDKKDIDFEPYFDRIVNIIKHFDTNDAHILVYCDTGVRLAPIAVIIYLLYKTYIINESFTEDVSIVSDLLLSIKNKIRDVDYYNLVKITEQLINFENKLKERKKENLINN